MVFAHSPVESPQPVIKGPLESRRNAFLTYLKERTHAGELHETTVTGGTVDKDFFTTTYTVAENDGVYTRYTLMRVPGMKSDRADEAMVWKHSFRGQQNPDGSWQQGHEVIADPTTNSWREPSRLEQLFMNIPLGAGFIATEKAPNIPDAHSLHVFSRPFPEVNLPPRPVPQAPVPPVPVAI